VDSNTRQLILQAQSGNHTAFHELVTKHDERIMILAYQMTKNEKDAEDLYQDVFLKAFKYINQFEFRSEFYTWLYRITVNTAYNYHRKRSRMHIVDPGPDNDYDPLNWVAADELDETPSDEVRGAVKECLTILPKQQRTVFILKHLQKLKIKDIAAIMGVSEGTVKKYLFRAMEKLRVALKEYRYV